MLLLSKSRFIVCRTKQIHPFRTGKDRISQIPSFSVDKYYFLDFVQLSTIKVSNRSSKIPKSKQRPFNKPSTAPIRVTKFSRVCQITIVPNRPKMLSAKVKKRLEGKRTGRIDY
jgi:hypothetical protein